jgi:hypothetical protein
MGIEESNPVLCVLHGKIRPLASDLKIRRYNFQTVPAGRLCCCDVRFSFGLSVAGPFRQEAQPPIKWEPESRLLLST